MAAEAASAITTNLSTEFLDRNCGGNGNNLPPSTKTDVTQEKDVAKVNVVAEASAPSTKEKMNLSVEFLTSMVNSLVENNTENGKILGPIPNNELSVFSPAAFCRSCVKRIASYFEGEDLSKNVTRHADGKAKGEEKTVVIKETERMAEKLLDSMKLQFYDHVTVQGFNRDAMRQGGKLYAIPLSLAAIIDESNVKKTVSDLFSKLGGKDVEKASLSSGIVMCLDTSTLPNLSGSGFKTHGQVVDESIDSDQVKMCCSCMMNTDWLVNRKTKVARLADKVKNIVGSGDCSNGDDNNEEESENEETEIETEDGTEYKVELSCWNDDTDFRPSASIPCVKKREDFDARLWTELRTSSCCCLSLCRHNDTCPMNDINKFRVVKALKLIPVQEPPKNTRETVTCVDDPDDVHYTVFPDENLLFSLGSSTYESIARYRSESSFPDHEHEYDGVDDQCEAKVYVTVHTIASPFGVPSPISNISHSNICGDYKTFRVCLPSNFSGTHNDQSVIWRSCMYQSFATNEVVKLCSNRQRDDNPPSIYSNIVDDGRGDISGNFLRNGTVCYFMPGVFAAAPFTAISSLKNAYAKYKQLQVRIAELLMGSFKQQLIECCNVDENGGGDNNNTTPEVKRAMQIVRCEYLQLTANTIKELQIAKSLLERDIGVTFKTMAANIRGFCNNLDTTLASSLADECNFYLV